MDTFIKEEPLNREVILTFLRERKQQLRDEFGVTKIALFGSYARNEARPDSDIDLLIDMEPKSYTSRFLLKEYLEAHFCKKVDVGYFGSVRTFVMRFVEKDLMYV